MLTQSSIAVLLLNNNRKQDILRLLNSLNSQTDKNFEVFILNNGCYRGGAIGKEMDQFSFRSFVVTENETHSLAVGFNLLARIAFLHPFKGIVLLHRLTEIKTNLIETIVALSKNDNTVWGGVLQENGGTAYIKLNLFSGRHHWNRIRKDWYMSNWKEGVLSSYPVYLPRGVFEKCKGFDVRYYSGMELEDISLKARAKGYELKVSNELVALSSVQSIEYSFNILEAYFAGRNFLLLGYRHFSKLHLAVSLVMAILLSQPLFTLMHLFKPGGRHWMRQYRQGLSDGIRLGLLKIMSRQETND